MDGHQVKSQPSSGGDNASAAAAIAAVADSADDGERNRERSRDRRRSQPGSLSGQASPSVPQSQQVQLLDMNALEKILTRVVAMSQEAMQRAVETAVATALEQTSSRDAELQKIVESLNLVATAVQANAVAEACDAVAKPMEGVEGGSVEEIHDCFEKLNRKLDPRLLEETKSIVKELDAKMTEVRRLKMKIEAIQKDMGKLRKFESPNGTKPYRPGFLPKSFESTHPKCAVEDYTLSIVFKKGSSFADVKKQWHFECIAFEKAIDEDNARARLPELEAHVAFEAFLKRITNAYDKIKSQVNDLGHGSPDGLLGTSEKVLKENVGKLYRGVLLKLSRAIDKGAKEKERAEKQRAKLAEAIAKLSPDNLEAARQWKLRKDATDKAVTFNPNIDYKKIIDDMKNGQVTDFAKYIDANAEAHSKKRRWTRSELSAKKRGEQVSPGGGQGQNPKGNGKGKGSAKGKGKAKPNRKGKGKGKPGAGGKNLPKGGSGHQPKGQSTPKNKHGGKGKQSQSQTDTKKRTGDRDNGAQKGRGKGKTHGKHDKKNGKGGRA